MASISSQSLKRERSLSLPYLLRVFLKGDSEGHREMGGLHALLRVSYLITQDGLKRGSRMRRKVQRASIWHLREGVTGRARVSGLQ